MEDLKHVYEEIQNVLDQNLTGVLATEGEKGPWTTLVAFSASEDLRTLWFATSRVTRKFNNLVRNSNISMLIDNRTNSLDDLYAATALSVTGEAREIMGNERDRALEILNERHGYLDSFFSSPTVAIIEVTVEKYIIVTAFQKVREITPI